MYVYDDISLLLSIMRLTCPNFGVEHFCLNGSYGRLREISASCGATASTASAVDKEGIAGITIRAKFRQKSAVLWKLFADFGWHCSSETVTLEVQKLHS